MNINTRAAHLTLFGTALITLIACGGGAPSTAPGVQTTLPAPTGDAPPDAGKSAMISASDIVLGDIDKGLVEKGKGTYDVKCQACHSLGENRVVGPGWKGVLTRRQPEWVMNMIMNTEAMLSTDAEAQKMLEQCLVRMPNQNLTKEDARNVVEFMRTL